MAIELVVANEVALNSAVNRMAAAIKANTAAKASTYNLVVAASYVTLDTIFRDTKAGKAKMAEAKVSEKTGKAGKVTRTYASKVWDKVIRGLVDAEVAVYEGTEDLIIKHLYIGDSAPKTGNERTQGISDYLKAVPKLVERLRNGVEDAGEKFTNPHELAATVRKARTLYSNVVEDVYLNAFADFGGVVSDGKPGKRWVAFFTGRYGERLTDLIATFAGERKMPTPAMAAILAQLEKIDELDTLNELLAEVTQRRDAKLAQAAAAAEMAEELARIAANAEAEDAEDGDESENVIPLRRAS